jgi:signal transduction histidine kinase
MLYYVALGLAALHPSMVSLSEPTPSSTRLTRTRLALLAAATLMAPAAMLVIQAAREEPIDVGVIAGGSVVLFLLALARMGGLASEVAMQTERKRAMQTVLRATEQERIRLAADLHDGPVQELTALRYGLTRARGRIQHGQPDQAEGLLAELEDELAAGITGLRRLLAELHPAVLDEQGLEVALHNQAGENGSVRLRINDDGVGFDPTVAGRLLSQGHFGLAGMRERVEMVGGHLAIDSAPGRGTTVDVEMANRPVEQVGG